MGFELRQELKVNQAIRLSHEAKLELRQLLGLRLELHSPPPMEACTGLEGIGEANKVLQQKNYEAF